MGKEFLVGSTGFVGSNLALAHTFSGLFHSTNITDAYGEEPDLLVYAGIPAEMFLANQAPNQDRKIIEQAQYSIREIAPKQLVLVSTVAVYPVPKDVDEETEIDATALPAYGVNRYSLERWVEENIPDHLIVRLPALFGERLKKNFLYDYIHLIPPLLRIEKYQQLVEREGLLAEYYQLGKNGFYQCRGLTAADTAELKNCFQRLGFTALHFTDSRSRYQFYDLGRLWGHIELALQKKLTKLNITTPPLEIGKLYEELTGQTFENRLTNSPFAYDVKSLYAHLFGGKNGYILSQEAELADIKRFLQTQGVVVK